MTLGDVRFSMKEGAYTSLVRVLEVRVARMDRDGGIAGRQILGHDETLDIEGVCYPGLRPGAIDKIERLREMARSYRPKLLTDGLGNIWGLWMIERVDERATVFTVDGQPQKQEFRLALGQAAFLEEAP